MEQRKTSLAAVQAEPLMCDSLRLNVSGRPAHAVYAKALEFPSATDATNLVPRTNTLMCYVQDWTRHTGVVPEKLEVVINNGVGSGSVVGCRWAV